MSVRMKYTLCFTVLTALLSCSFIDLGDIDISLYPGTPNSILAGDEKITLTFSEPVNKEGFEALFSLVGVSGNEDGDFIWADSAADSLQVLTFFPHRNLQPGFRYRLKISGEIVTRDGRIFLKKINVPFYFLTDAIPPVLKNASLADAEITDVHTPLVLGFSKTVEQSSFDDGFRLRPAAEFNTEWNTAGDQVTISPSDQWLNLQYYRWTLTTDITDTDGIPLPAEHISSFLVQIDTSAPELLAICPAADVGDGSFILKTLLTADDLLLNEHLALTFSEAIELNSLKQNLSFDPSLDGYLSALSPNVMLYYIYEELPPGTLYELRIDAGFEDQSGNAAASDIIQIFTPSIPIQQITSIAIQDENGVFLTLTGPDFNSDGFIDTTGLDYYGTDRLHLIINVSEGYPISSINERLLFEDSVKFMPVFPPGTLPPSILLSSWDSDNSLRLIYEDLSSSSPGEPVYYEFKIAAGDADSANPAGAYLTESVSFRMLAEVN